MMETLACIKETLQYSEKEYGQHQFLCLCALGMDAQSESFQTIERWMDAVFIVKGGASPFELSFYSINKQQDPASMKVVYSLSSCLEVLSINFER